MEAAKGMVRKSLKRAGFRVVDVGRGVTPESFVSKAKEIKADIIVVSVLLSAAKANLSKLVSQLEAQGLKDKVTVIIGGAAVTREDADKIGAMFGTTREEAVVLAQKAMEQKQNKK